MTDVANGASLAIQLVIVGLGALTLGMSLWAAREGSPLIALFGRWIRWIFLATLVAGATWIFGWSGYGFPTLLLVSLLGLFLIETAYNWIAISALSKSELPLFPRFEENDRGDEWPSTPAFIRIKDWIRQNDYQKAQALVSTLGDTVLMRLSVYENEAGTERLQVLFLPNPRGNTAVCFSFVSVTRGGRTLLTDNVFLPFGGFYPENWEVERRPWTRSPGKLLERHRARIDAAAEPLAPFVISPLEQINEDQRRVERINRELGFLREISGEPGESRLTTAGKARVWQEVWTLSYLGLPLKYT
jgi:hypothetical protein